MESLRRKMNIGSAIEGEVFHWVIKVNYAAKDYETSLDDI
jgi:hypothetical protein